MNPAHLFLGTQLDNMRDRNAKGRGNFSKGDKHWMRQRPEEIPRGERHSQAKLTEQAVRQIITSVKAGERQQVVADRHGVVVSAVNSIMKGRTWAHIFR